MKDINVNTALIARALYAQRLGMQYNDERNIYQALGYPNEIKIEDYLAKFMRQDIAHAIINRPVEATWRGGVKIQDSKEDETELEKSWGVLVDDIKLVSAFSRLDKLAGIGEYGVLLLGFDDVENQDQWQIPVTKGRELLYTKPFSQLHAKIDKWVVDTKDPRYDKPRMYKIDLNSSAGVDRVNRSLLVHYSRVLHVSGEQLEDDVLGLPRLQVVYNRLLDLEKTVGGSAEMYWRGARPGITGKLDEDRRISTEEEDRLEGQLDEFDHNLRRFLVTEGMDLKTLQQQISDPSTSVDVQLKMISAVTGIPIRILTGSERGELASGEDRNNWFDLIGSRRKEFAEPQIVRPFIEMCQEAGALPAGSDDWAIDWEDLYAQSDASKAEVGKTRTEALAAYSRANAQEIVSPDAFLEFMLGMDKEDVEKIQEMTEKFMKTVLAEEEKEAKEIEKQRLLNPDMPLGPPQEAEGVPVPGVETGSPAPGTPPKIPPKPM